MAPALSILFFISVRFTRPRDSSNARKNRPWSFLQSLSPVHFFLANAVEINTDGCFLSARSVLLKRDDTALILLVDEICNLLRLKNLDELLRPVRVLILLCYSDDVTIGLCSLGVRILLNQCVGRLEASLDRVVTVHASEIYGINRSRNLRSLYLEELYIVRILDDILLGGLETSTILQGDDTIILQEEKRTCLVGGIVRNRDLCTIGDVCEIRRLAGVDTERLIVDLAYRYEAGLVLCIEVIEVWLVLEVVCLDLTLLGREVRLYIIVVGYNFNVYTSGRKVILRCLEDLCVWAWCRTDLDVDRLSERLDGVGCLCSSGGRLSSLCRRFRCSLCRCLGCSGGRSSCSGCLWCAG